MGKWLMVVVTGVLFLPALVLGWLAECAELGFTAGRNVCKQQIRDYVQVARK